MEGKEGGTPCYSSQGLSRGEAAPRSRAEGKAFDIWALGPKSQHH